MGVTVTRARRWHIDGKDQRGAARRFGALQRVTHKTAIAQDVQLEPHRAFNRRRDFLDGADRNGGEGKRNPFRIGGGGGLNFTATRIHSAQANRSQLFVKQGGFQAQVGHILQHALAERHL